MSRRSETRTTKASVLPWPWAPLGMAVRTMPLPVVRRMV